MGSNPSTSTNYRFHKQNDKIMEQLITFVLGVLSVVAVAAVVRVFGMKKTVALMIDDRIDDVTQELHGRIDMVERELEEVDNRLYEYIDQLHSKHDEDVDKIYSYIDSRTDKMADGTAKHIADINARFNDNTAFVDLLSHRIEDLESKS